MQTERTQAEFESQWRPIPAEDFPLPACPAGMVLLKAFADAHPHSFEFIWPEDFVHFENEAFTGIEEWDRFTRHCLSCYALPGTLTHSRSRRGSYKAICLQAWTGPGTRSHSGGLPRI